MNIRKILIGSGIIIFVCIALFYLWAAFIFFPDDFEITRKEALLKAKDTKISESSVIDVSLIDLIDSAEISDNYTKDNIINIVTGLLDKNFLIKDDSFITAKRRNICFRVGTGLPGIWVDERSSIIIPDKGEISFNLNLKDSPSFEFSVLSFLSGGTFSIDITDASGKKLHKKYKLKNYKHIYSSKDVPKKMNNRGYEKAIADLGWNKYSFDLTDFSHKKIKISFSFAGEKGVSFIANPRIFKKSKKRRYNVVYLIFDGVSTRHLSVYNEKSKLTPYMKKIVDKEFVVFNNMFALGNKTRISTAGLFTSVLPLSSGHGINRNFIPEKEKEKYYKKIRSKKFASLPDVFRRNGFITQQYGNSGFSVHLITTGIDYGFEKSYEFSYNPYDSYALSHRVFDFLRKNRNREFFLYLHYNSTHKPFFYPPKYFFRGLIDAPLECFWRPDFMGAISYTDDVFRNIYSAFKTNDLLENTIFIIATDHGAGYTIDKYDKGFHYNDFSRMTFMVRLPEELKKELKVKKKRINTYMSQINIAPTLLDLSNIKIEKAFKGRSFVNVLRGDYKKKFFDKKLWCFGRKTASLITDDLFKYIISFPDGRRFYEWQHLFFGNQKELPFEEIYDLNKDPLEKNNLVGTRKLILKKFRKIFLESDIHHPESTILAFLPNDEKERFIEIDVKSNSRVIDAILYSKDLKEIKTLKTDYRKKISRFSFKVKDKPLYLKFENEDDRSALSIHIKSNGKTVNKNRIYSTYLNVNILDNPIILKKYKDFYLLNDAKLPEIDFTFIKRKGLFVKISRIDLHRWIDIGNFAKKGISAGMKETLKSWGYIQ